MWPRSPIIEGMAPSRSTGPAPSARRRLFKKRLAAPSLDQVVPHLAQSTRRRRKGRHSRRARGSARAGRALVAAVRALLSRAAAAAVEFERCDSMSTFLCGRSTLSGQGHACQKISLFLPQARPGRDKHLGRCKQLACAGRRPRRRACVLRRVLHGGHAAAQASSSTAARVAPTRASTAARRVERGRRARLPAARRRVRPAAAGMAEATAARGPLAVGLATQPAAAGPGPSPWSDGDRHRCHACRSVRHVLNSHPPADATAFMGLSHSAFCSRAEPARRRRPSTGCLRSRVRATPSRIPRASSRPRRWCDVSAMRRAQREQERGRGEGRLTLADAAGRRGAAAELRAAVPCAHDSRRSRCSSRTLRPGDGPSPQPTFIIRSAPAPLPRRPLRLMDHARADPLRQPRRHGDLAGGGARARVCVCARVEQIRPGAHRRMPSAADSAPLMRWRQQYGSFIHPSSRLSLTTSLGRARIVTSLTGCSC